MMVMMVQVLVIFIQLNHESVKVCSALMWFSCWIKIKNRRFLQWMRVSQSLGSCWCRRSRKKMWCRRSRKMMWCWKRQTVLLLLLPQPDLFLILLHLLFLLLARDSWRKKTENEKTESEEQEGRELGRNKQDYSVDRIQTNNDDDCKTRRRDGWDVRNKSRDGWWRSL